MIDKQRLLIAAEKEFKVLSQIKEEIVEESHWLAINTYGTDNHQKRHENLVTLLFKHTKAKARLEIFSGMLNECNGENNTM